MANAERKRAKNLTKQDVELLTDLVFRFKHIIENKKTDAITVKQKNDAWETISDEFSASASHPRNAEQLKNYYKNTKSNLKKELAKEKADHFRTGGGSTTARIIKDTPLLAIVQPEITPLSNPYDSSSAYFNDEPQPSTSRGSAHNKFEEAYNEFIRLGGDPAMLGDDEDHSITNAASTAEHPLITDPEHSPFEFNSCESPLEDPAINATAHAATAPASTAPVTPARVAVTPAVPVGNIIRNNKRHRINFNSLREYVGELGELKKKKYELQNKLLELQIQKLEREVNAP